MLIRIGDAQYSAAPKADLMYVHNSFRRPLLLCLEVSIIETPGDSICLFVCFSYLNRPFPVRGPRYDRSSRVGT